MYKKLLIIFLFLFLFLLFFKFVTAPVSETEPLNNIVFCPSSCFYISKDGLLLDEAPELKGSLITLIKSQKIPSPDLLKYVLELKSQFESQIDIKIREINLNGAIKIITNEDWQIIFEKQSSPEKLVLILSNILDKEIKEKRGNLEYIDMRLENKVYYKLK